MKCFIDYRIISKNEVIFGYNCDSLGTLFSEKERLIGSINEYCSKTKKKIETSVYITDSKDSFILEIKVSK